MQELVMCLWTAVKWFSSVWYSCVFQEDFLDLTVAVKNVSGLEDALWNMYVEEEVFDCDNLYHCGTCDRLVKAAKVKTDPCLPLGAPLRLAAPGFVEWSLLAWESLEDKQEAPHFNHELKRRLHSTDLYFNFLQ